MVKFVKKLRSFKVILFVLIMLTILYFVLNPRKLLFGSKKYNTEYTILERAQKFIFLKDNPVFDYLLILFKNRGVTFKLRNKDTNKLSEQHIQGFTFRSIFNGDMSNIYFDEDNNSYYTILAKDNADYYLYNIYKDNAFNGESDKILRHPVYDELQDSVITINNIKFYPFTFSDKNKLIEYHNGYRITISKDEQNIERLKNLNRTIIEQDTLLSELNTVVQNKTNLKFNNYDMYKMIQFFFRRNFYKSKAFSYNDNRLRGFMGSHIYGKIDSDNNGTKEFLIGISGNRYLNDILLCYDAVEKKIIWQREFANGFSSTQIIDIDGDGKEEILISTSSHCNELPIDWFEKNAGFTHISYFYILNNDGRTKIINNKPCIVESKPGFKAWKYYFDKQNNKMLLGIMSDNEIDPKKLKILDLKTNKVSDTEISYTSIIDFFKEKNKISVIDSHNGKLTKMLLNKNYEVTKTYSAVSGFKGVRFHTNTVKLFNRDFYLTNDFAMYDMKLNSLEIGGKPNYTNNPITIINNEMFFNVNENNVSKLASMKFTHDKTINPYVIILFLAEFMLLLVYFLLKQYINIPMKSVNSSYFVMYSWLERFYYWKILGKLNNIYKLPKKISTNRTTPMSILNEISEENKLVYKRNFVFFKYFVYQVKFSDEFQIIQRISHDLKNQVLTLKLTAEQYESELKNISNDYLQNLNEAFSGISQAAITLSNFSHINKLFLEKTNLIKFIDELLMSYINHPDFRKLHYDFYEQKEVIVAIDKKMIRIALKNIINNALEAVSEDQNVNLQILTETEYVKIIVTNPIQKIKGSIQNLESIGYTTKITGSGLGIPIAKSIIEKHKGFIEIDIIENQFVVIVYLPIK